MTSQVAWALRLSLVLAVTAGVSGADGIVWHESFDSALHSAQTSQKPILVFAYVIDSPTYEQMAEITLVHEDVVSASQQFECVAVNVSDQATDDVQRRLSLGPVRDESGGVHGSYPITAFLDPSGREQFRKHGFMPPGAFAGQLARAHHLIACLNAVAQQPRDARLHRGLGRAYMELEISPGDKYYDAAIAHLRRAIQLDPDNATGAKLDAQIDLAIFSVPENPSNASMTLAALKDQVADGPRRFEVQYYLAVAQCAMGSEKVAAQEAATGQELSEPAAAAVLKPYYAAAVNLLMPFRTDDTDSPYYQSEWAEPALILLYALRPDLNPTDG